MSDIKFGQEYFTDFYPDAIKLFHKHNEEINLFGLDLKINTEHYLRSEENNALKIFTLRDQGKLIGYCAFFLFNHSHHMNGVHAKQDVFFVDKPYRGGLGRKLIEFSDKSLKEMGVNFVHQCVPECNDWSQLVVAMGYKKLETVYLKEL